MAFLVVLMVLFGGMLAYGGDWLGRRLGKQRLSLLGLRPRYTATLITTLTGALTVALTVTGMTLANEAFREWITRGDQILIELRRNERLLHQRAAELKSLQQEVQQQTQELNRLRPEYERLKAQVPQLQQQLQQGQAQLTQMERQLQAEAKRVQALHAERGQLLQQVSALRQQSHALQREIAQLERTQQLLRNQNDLFAEENARLASENARMEKQNQQLSEQNAQLEAQNRTLEERNRQLETQNQHLLDRAAALRRQRDELQSEVGELLRLVNIRLMPIAVHAGEELNRIAFRPGLSEVRLRQMLSDMMQQAAEQARARGAAPGSDGRTVFIPEKVVRLTTGEQIKVDETASLETILRNIRESGEPVVALVVAVTNAAKGEPVPVEVRLFRNGVIFQAGQEIARTILDCRPAQDPFQQIVAFLRGDVRQAAIEAGVIPRVESQGAQPTVGEMDAATLLALAEKARRCPGERALLIARARQETRAGDKLELEFEVRPLSSAGRHSENAK
ncbi:Chromosome partition protein Smc [bacterium HR15]|nr:Chromosome partition protein Smc [bacterium HR15]